MTDNAKRPVREIPAPTERPSTGFEKDFALQYPPPKDPTSLYAPEDVVLVRFIKRSGLRPIRGPKTGLMYGHYSQMGEFNMVRDDIIAYRENPNTRNWFQVLKETLPPPPFNLQDIPGIGPATAEKLSNRGVSEKKHLLALGVDGLVAAGVRESQAQAIISLLKTEQEPEEPEEPEEAEEPEEPEVVDEESDDESDAD